MVFIHLYSYKQFFDIEGESGVVVRGIGTCVGLAPKPPNLQGFIPICFPATMEGVRPVSTQTDGYVHGRVLITSLSG